MCRLKTWKKKKKQKRHTNHAKCIVACVSVQSTYIYIHMYMYVVVCNTYNNYITSVLKSRHREKEHGTCGVGACGRGVRAVEAFQSFDESSHTTPQKKKIRDKVRRRERDGAGPPCLRTFQFSSTGEFPNGKEKGRRK